MAKATVRTAGKAAIAAWMVIAGTTAACGDDDDGAKAPTPDGGIITPTQDANAGDTSVGPGPDGGDGGTDGSVAEAKPINVPISASGHDRFYGVTFDAAGNVYATGVKAAGTDAGDDYQTVIAKFTPAGVLDTTFGTAGVATVNLAVAANGELTRGIVILSTGKIVVAGTVEAAVPVVPLDKDVALARLNANGTLDTTFGTNGVLNLNLSDPELTGAIFDAQWGLRLAAGDKLVMSAQVRAAGRSDSDYAVLRLNADGSRDTTFGAGLDGIATIDIDGTAASVRNVNVLADGSIVAGGYMHDADNITRPVVYKLDPNGIPDPTFATNGIYNDIVLASQTEAYATASQGNKLVTTGYGRASTSESLDVLSLRLTAAGVLDTTYGTNGVARIDVAGDQDQSRFLLVLPDNRVVLVGAGRTNATNSDAMVIVLTPDGKPDTTWGPKGYRLYDLGGNADFFWSAALSPDKKTIAIAGIAGAPAAGGDDDAVIFMLPVPK